METLAVRQEKIEKDCPYIVVGQPFEAAGERSNPFEIRWSVTCRSQGFFKCLGVTGFIVDEKYIAVCMTYRKRLSNV